MPRAPVVRAGGRPKMAGPATLNERNSAHATVSIACTRRTHSVFGLADVAACTRHRLAGQDRDRRRSLRRRRQHRRHGADGEQPAFDRAEAEFRRGEPRRRGRRARRRLCRAGDARRLHAAVRRRAADRGGAAHPEGQLRPAERPRAGQRVRDRTVHPRDQRRDPGEDHAGVRRLRKRQEAQLRLRRHRLDRTLVGRAVRGAGRSRFRARPVQGRRSRDDVAGRRSDRHVFRQRIRDHPACGERQGPHPRRRHRQAHATASERADDQRALFRISRSTPGTAFWRRRRRRRRSSTSLRSR